MTICDADGVFVSDIEITDVDDQSLIVRAVNAHDSLVAALEVSVDLMANAMAVIDGEYSGKSYRHPDAIDLEAAIEKSESVLKLARGEA